MRSVTAALRAWCFWLPVLLALAFCSIRPVHATWKPEYALEPQAVQDWFANANMPHCQGAGCSCCKTAERFMTKFVATKGNEWSYYTDANCTHKGCELKPIPDEVVHDEEIHAADPKDDALPQFQEMRQQGVLFIFYGKPRCFWPPERADQ